MNHVGQACLLARRLVEAGVPFVNVHWCQTPVGSWDTHSQNFKQMKRSLAPTLDASLFALLTDLEERGLSDDILLVITGEMGRTPTKSNKDGGTNHHGSLTPLLLAGGGLKMGQAIGRSDRTASRPASQPYGPENLLTTVLHTMFDAAELRISPERLPAEVTKVILDGQPIRELF